MLALASTIGSFAVAPQVVGQSDLRGSIVVLDADADGDAAALRVIRGHGTGIWWPGAMVVDRRGRLYVTNAPNTGRDDTVRVFAPDADGDVAPERIIAGPHTGLKQPLGFAIDRENHLYVANAGADDTTLRSQITVYDPGAAGDANPLAILAGGLSREDAFWPHRLTFGRRDSLFVRTGGFVAVFAPGATEASVPARLIYTDVPRPPGGAYGWRRSPDRFVLDRNDSMYVLRGDTVMVYPPGYSGREPEVRRIAGPRTGITRAKDIALDDRGWLYVVGWDSSAAVKVFAPGATGDVAPSRKIGGTRTRLRYPDTIVLDRKRRLYLGNPGGGSRAELDRP
ncbi:MAG TPA: hypothetical protein VIG08_08155 [Gemmatimonadales bacterium]|jgi:hypothetical protein